MISILLTINVQITKLRKVIGLFIDFLNKAK